MCLGSRRIPLNRRSRHPLLPNPRNLNPHKGHLPARAANRALPAAARVSWARTSRSLIPGSNIATWDGKSWNISNNALFQARFEKYLNAPPATPPETEYQATPQANHGKALAWQGHAPVHRSSLPVSGKGFAISTGCPPLRLHCEPGLLRLACAQEQRPAKRRQQEPRGRKEAPRMERAVNRGGHQARGQQRRIVLFEGGTIRTEGEQRQQLDRQGRMGQVRPRQQAAAQP